jgi:hypothetical protein
VPSCKNAASEVLREYQEKRPRRVGSPGPMMILGFRRNAPEGASPILRLRLRAAFSDHDGRHSEAFV